MIFVLIFSIVNRDDSDTVDESERRFAWDVYHIENCQLYPKVVSNALKNTTLQVR